MGCELEELLMRMASHVYQRFATDADSGVDMYDVSMPISIENLSYFDPPESSLTLRDRSSGKTVVVYRGDDHPYLEYRIAILGLGRLVRSVSKELAGITEDRDLLDGEHDLWGRFLVLSFDGDEPQWSRDLFHFADRMAAFSPNLIAVVAAGELDLGLPQTSDLVTLTRYVNILSKAWRRPPFSSVWIVDELLDAAKWDFYQATCRENNIWPFDEQCLLGDVGRLPAQIRASLETYCRNDLEIRRT